GLAPAEEGAHSTIPPRRVGGNMDLRDIAAGAQILLPVECEGGLFSAGDTHAAQGDGEICGTAIESPLNGVFKFELMKNAAPESPIIITNEPSSAHKEDKGYWITTGIGPDIWEAIKSSAKQMIDLLTREQKLSPTDAYMLISVCADLRISQIVDAPNWTISLYFPRSVFE
ncbi:MAG: acetamidase/formamidase family protein, partial [Alphaproteobacteria bacterium]